MCKHSISLLFKLAQINLIQFITDTAERFPTWVEDVFQQTSQLQCSQFPSLCILMLLPQAGISSNSSLHCYIVMCHGFW